MNSEAASKIVNLMQFARKAGKVISGADACLRALHARHLHLVVIAEDTAERTFKRISNATHESGSDLPIYRIWTIATLSAALGLPLTGVYGVTDRQFAAKMREYHSTAEVEE